MHTRLSRGRPAEAAAHLHDTQVLTCCCCCSRHRLVARRNWLQVKTLRLVNASSRVQPTTCSTSAKGKRKRRAQTCQFVRSAAESELTNLIASFLFEAAASIESIFPIVRLATQLSQVESRLLAKRTRSCRAKRLLSRLAMNQVAAGCVPTNSDATEPLFCKLRLSLADILCE